MLKKLITDYCRRGFGSMNKNDFEIWIFNQIIHGNIESDGPIDPSSDYELSLFLRIPEAKVKRMRYEASLKYPEKPDYAQLFIKYAASAKYDKPQKDMVTLQIKDVAFRKYLEAQLTNMNKFSDSSFNSNLIKISKSDFIELFDKVCLTEQERTKIISTLRENSADTTKDRMKELGKDAIMGAAKVFAGEVGEHLTAYCIDGLIERFSEDK